ncbi:hypothetical protein ACFRK5_34785 [Streptomyces niveus]|uniref:hypothetical protein n=1 Tax=Streptomyces niveus TaxID=193462 RepID=UPI00369CCFE6
MTGPGRPRVPALCALLLLALTACAATPTAHREVAGATVPPAVETPRRTGPPPAPGALPPVPPAGSASPRTTAGLPTSPRFPPRVPTTATRPGSPTRMPATPDAPATPTRKPSAKAPGKPTGIARPTGTTLRIGSWSARVVRGGQEEVDACRDAVQWAGPDLGTENGYAMRTAVVVGHDFCGFGQLATLPIGTEVTVETSRALLRYRVYARHLTPGRGAPAHGLYWGDLTLQSCVGPDTGFTYLTRV